MYRMFYQKRSPTQRWSQNLEEVVHCEGRSGQGSRESSVLPENLLTDLLDDGKVINVKGSVIVRNKLELEIELVYIQGHPLSKGKCPLNRECFRVFNNQQTKKTIYFPLPRNLL